MGAQWRLDVLRSPGPQRARCPRAAPRLPAPGARSASLSLSAGRLVASLVAEFLQFFNLDFTLAVFQPETSTVRMRVSTPWMK